MDARPEAVLREIVTERLVLEPLTAAHAAEMYAVLADPLLYLYLPLDPPASVEALGERYGRLARGYSLDEDEVWLNWIVRVRATGQAVGHVQATIYEDLSSELGFVFARHALADFAPEACAAVIETLWGAYGVERIEFLLDNRNVEAAGVAEALGFEVVGIEPARDYHTGEATEEVLLVLTPAADAS